jgi:hypothetical protein
MARAAEQERLWLSEAKARRRGVAEEEELVRRRGSAAGGDMAAHGRSWSSGSRGGAAEQRARARIDGGGCGWKREMEKIDRDERLKERRSAFHGVTERAGAASDQSPVSSWHDRTRIESNQRSPRNPSRLTRHGGGVRDRTQWSQRRVRSSVQS